MRFEKGNTAAAGKRGRKVLAEMIHKKLVDERESLSPEQITSLVGKYDSLTSKKGRRHRTKSQAETFEFGGSYTDTLPEAEKVILREVLRIEAEKLTAAREKWRREHGIEPEEYVPATPAVVEVFAVAASSTRKWLLKPDV